MTVVDSILKAICYIIAYIVDIVQWIIWYDKKQYFKRNAESVRAKQTDPDDPFSPYRCVSSLDGLLSSFSTDVKTLADFPEYCKEQFGKKIMFGTRALLDIVEEKQPNGHNFKKYILDSQYKWANHEEVCKRIHDISSGLLALGVKPGDSIAILCETRLEWFLLALACTQVSIRVVTLYATLSNDEIVHALNETGTKYVATSSHLMDRLTAVLEERNDVNIEKVIYIVGQSDYEMKQVTKYLENKDVNKYTNLSAVEKLGSDFTEKLPDPPEPDDVAFVMYTSGSTGLPKGVLITHRNLVAAIAGFKERIGQHVDHSVDVLISYLPLAHIYELLVELYSFSHGLPIGFSSPHTLTNRSTGIRRGDLGDISVLKPTLMASVPMVLERVVDTIKSRMKKMNIFVQFFINFLLELKRIALDRGIETPLLDRFVFSRANKVAFGGRLKHIMCGGAAINPDSQRFIECTLCVNVFQAYGLTETLASGTAADQFDRSLGTVGHPIESIEIRLKNWNEGGYLNTDKPNARGEILIGGSSVAKGYLPRLSGGAHEEEFNFIDIEGVHYFCTGDIGEIDHLGILHIIDRKKDLVKTSRGEYVSLAKVENAAMTSSLVQTCCSFMNKDGSAFIILIVPNEDQLKVLLEKNGTIDYNQQSLEEICRDQVVNELVLVHLKEKAFKSRLEKFEIPLAVGLISDVWEPGSNLLTASIKVKRKNIFETYRRIIEDKWHSCLTSSL